MAAFSKMIKSGFALTVFGFSGLAIHNQTGILSDTFNNSIFIVLLGLSSILVIIGCCKGDISELIRANSRGFHPKDGLLWDLPIIVTSFTTQSP